jgi:hypothetical protein
MKTPLVFLKLFWVLDEIIKTIISLEKLSYENYNNILLMEKEIEKFKIN